MDNAEKVEEQETAQQEGGEAPKKKLSVGDAICGALDMVKEVTRLATVNPEDTSDEANEGFVKACKELFDTGRGLEDNMVRLCAADDLLHKVLDSMQEEAMKRRVGVGSAGLIKLLEQAGISVSFLEI